MCVSAEYNVVQIEIDDNRGAVDDDAAAAAQNSFRGLA